jgi:hypothetical protein
MRFGTASSKVDFHRLTPLCVELVIRISCEVSTDARRMCCSPGMQATRCAREANCRLRRGFPDAYAIYAASTPGDVTRLKLLGSRMK